jgi:hypothetical protein
MVGWDNRGDSVAAKDPAEKQFLIHPGSDLKDIHTAMKSVG